MPSTVVALVLPLLALLAAPAAATPDGVGESATGGFTITIVALIAGATLFALVWRALSKKREGR